MENIQMKSKLTFKLVCAKVLSKVKNFFKKIYGNKKSGIGFTIIMLFVIMAIVGSFLPQADIVGKRFEAPTFEHWLGTDHLGRDLLLQIIAGSKDVLAIAFLLVSATGNNAIISAIDGSTVTKFMYANNILLNIIF